MFISHVRLSCYLLLTALWLPNVALAGIQPSVSAVAIPYGSKDGTIDIKNTGSESFLLYSKIIKLADDDLDGGTLYASPSTIVVGAGETQTVRMIFNTNKPLDREHLARVEFTALSPRGAQKARIQFALGQNLPVIIGVIPSVEEYDLWQLIKFSIKDKTICINNPSKKVFRFNNIMQPVAGGQAVSFSQTYLLPEHEICTQTPSGLSAGQKLKITTASTYDMIIADRVVTVE